MTFASADHAITEMLCIVMWTDFRAGEEAGQSGHLHLVFADHHFHNFLATLLLHCRPGEVRHVSNRKSVCVSKCLRMADCECVLQLQLCRVQPSVNIAQSLIYLAGSVSICCLVLRTLRTLTCVCVLFTAHKRSLDCAARLPRTVV